MIERKVIPRAPTLFEFCKEHNLPLIVEKGEHKHREPYVKMYVEGHTLLEHTNIGYSRTEKTYPQFSVDEASLPDAIREMIDKIVTHWICFKKEPIVKVPTLSYRVDGHEDFGILRGPKAVALFDWVEKENLPLVISTGENVKGHTYIQVEIKDYCAIYYSGRDEMAAAVAADERTALKQLVQSISENHIGPGGWENNTWTSVDRDKKIKVPALYV